MMKKKIIAILCLTMCLSLSACGDTNTEQTSADSSTETEDIADNEIETENETPEVDEEESPEENESEENEITASDGTPAAVNNEGLTVQEALEADGKYIDDLGYYTAEDWNAYAQSQGADLTMGAWFIYYAGQAAGDQPSYAVNQRTGERKVCGPGVYLYGDANSYGSDEFWGNGYYTFPGDKYTEAEMNQRRSIGEEEEYLHE